MKRTIKLSENKFKSLIKESVIKTLNLINEAHNEAFSRKNATAGMKKIWDVIDAKQKRLYDLVFGELSGELDKLTLQKSKLMGSQYLNIPNIVCRAGNDKLPESVLIVNMSSSLMCPSFYLGLCQITSGVCYAQQAENQYTNNVLPQRFQTDLMHTQMLRQYQNGNKQPMKEYFSLIELYIQLANKYASDECKRTIQQLEAKRREPFTKEEKEILIYEHSKNKITDVRLNETGDFHCQLAVDLWAKFAKKIKRKYGINTHAYTARRLDFSDASQYINMNYSQYNNYESEHQEPRFFKVVSDNFYNSLSETEVDKNGQPSLNTTKNGIRYYKCPCTKEKSMCDYCGVCFNPNKTGEKYTIFVKLHGQKYATGLKNAFTMKEITPVMGAYEENGWVGDNEKGKQNTKYLTNFSNNVERLRKNAEKAAEKSTKKTQSKKTQNKK